MPRPGLPVCLALAVLSSAAPAHGRRQDLCPYTPGDVVAPLPGATDVPTNAKIWLTFPDTAVRDIVLIGPGEIEPDVEQHVALSRETMHFGAHAHVQTTLTIWTPAEPLAPHTDYEVWSCEGASCSFMETTFRTGAGPASLTPPVPEVISIAGDRNNECGDAEIAIDVSFEGILVVDFAEGDPAAGSAGDGVLVSQRGDHVFPSPDDRNVSLRIGAYAVDGTFSGWSDPVAVELKGCTIADPSFPALLTLLPFLIRRRSRCRPWPPHAAHNRGDLSSGCRSPVRRAILAA